MDRPYPQILPDWLQTASPQDAASLLLRCVMRALPGAINLHSNDLKSDLPYYLHMVVQLTGDLRAKPVRQLAPFVPQITKAATAEHADFLKTLDAASQAFHNGRIVSDPYMTAVHRSGNVLDSMDSGIDAFQAIANQITDDIQRLDLGQEILHQPLFNGVYLPPTYSKFRSTLISFLAQLPHSEAWISWYEGYERGKPTAPVSERLLAEVEPSRGGGLFDQAKTGEEPVLDGRGQAEALLSRLPYAESLLFDTGTGKFQAEALPLTKPALVEVLVSRVCDALDDVIAKPSNGINIRSREYRVIVRCGEKYADNPQRLEMDFTAIHASVTRQMSSDELPATEENLGLQEALAAAVRGIRASHPEVAENRRILNTQVLGELSQSQKNAIQDALPVLVALSDQQLAEEWREDIPEVVSDADLAAIGSVHPLPQVDAAVRVFNRAAKMSLALKAEKILARIERSTGYRAIEVLGVLATLVSIGLALL